MNVNNGVSPSRTYQIIMATEDSETVEKVVTLPITLANNPETVEVWYQKYVPAGHLLIDIVPMEIIEETPAEPEYVSFGDSLDFTGEEPEDESEEDDNGESFVSFDPVTSPKDDV